MRQQVNNVSVGEIKGESKSHSGQVEKLATPSPHCGEGIVIRPKLFACTGCDFKIWSTIAEKKITTKQVETLIQKGKTSEIKGFSSKKTGKIFSAILVLQDKTSGKVGFEFNNNGK